jgi:hypothetical protein
LLKEPSKADWGGEENDHFSANVTISGIKRTGAFLLKGPAKFKEMTPAMCGKNGDQIYRLSKQRRLPFRYSAFPFDWAGRAGNRPCLHRAAGAITEILHHGRPGDLSPAQGVQFAALAVARRRQPSPST